MDKYLACPPQVHVTALLVFDKRKRQLRPARLPPSPIRPTHGPSVRRCVPLGLEYIHSPRTHPREAHASCLSLVPPVCRLPLILGPPISSLRHSLAGRAPRTKGDIERPAAGSLAVSATTVQGSGFSVTGEAPRPSNRLQTSTLEFTRTRRLCKKKKKNRKQ
jgi:hypothetical protein